MQRHAQQSVPPSPLYPAADPNVIEVASAATEEPNVKNDLITYYSILEKSSRVLVENFGEVALVDDTAKSLQKAEAEEEQS